MSNPLDEILGKAIYFNTNSEVVEILQILEDLGCKWQSGSVPTAPGQVSRTQMYMPGYVYVNPDGRLSRSSAGLIRRPESLTLESIKKLHSLDTTELLSIIKKNTKGVKRF